MLIIPKFTCPIVTIPLRIRLINSTLYLYWKPKRYIKQTLDFPQHSPFQKKQTETNKKKPCSSPTHSTVTTKVKNSDLFHFLPTALTPIYPHIYEIHLPNVSHICPEY